MKSFLRMPAPLRVSVFWREETVGATFTPATSSAKACDDSSRNDSANASFLISLPPGRGTLLQPYYPQPPGMSLESACTLQGPSPAVPSTVNTPPWLVSGALSEWIPFCLKRGGGELVLRVEEAGGVVPGRPPDPGEEHLQRVPLADVCLLYT